LNKQSNDSERAKNINNFLYDLPKNIGVRSREVKIADIKYIILLFLPSKTKCLCMQFSILKAAPKRAE